MSPKDPSGFPGEVAAPWGAAYTISGVGVGDGSSGALLFEEVIELIWGEPERVVEGGFPALPPAQVAPVVEKGGEARLVLEERYGAVTELVGRDVSAVGVPAFVGYQESQTVIEVLMARSSRRRW